MGCGSHAASEAVCVRGETRRCEGPARCAGAQACVADGTGWEACDCGEPSGAPSMDKGQRPRADGGTPAAGPDGMDAATAGDAAANDAASHTPASMDAALDAALPDAALPDAALADAGDSGEPDVPVIPDPDDDAGWPAGDG